jgi:hypothetical protein
MPRPIAHIPLLRQERDHSTRFRVACSMITTRNPRIRYRVFLRKHRVCGRWFVRLSDWFTVVYCSSTSHSVLFYH